MVKMGDVWDRAVEFLGEHLSLLLPVVLLGLVVPASISGSLEELRQTAGPGTKLALSLLSLAFAIVSLWVQLAIAALAIDPAIGRQMTAVATTRLLPAIGVYLLVMAALALLFLPIGILLAAGGFDFVAAQAGQISTIAPAYGLAVSLYSLVFLTAVLFVGSRLAPLTAVVVAERRGAGGIARAFRMTRGLTWRLVGVIILYVVVTTIAVLAAQTVFGSILRLFAGGGGPITLANVITAVVVAAVSSGFTVVAAAFAAKLYVAIQQTPAAALASAPESATGLS